MRAATRLCLVLSQVACFSETSGNSASGEDTSSADGGTSGAMTSSPQTTDPTTSGATSSSSMTGAEGATDDPATGESSVTTVDASSEAGSDSGDVCPPDSRLIPPVPVGWDGVFALARVGPQGEPAMCPPPMQPGDGYLEGPVSACDCACAPGCWVNGFSLDTCLEEPVDFDSGFDGACVNFNGPDALHVSLSFDDLGNDGGCFDPDEQPSIVADARYLECLHVNGEPCIPAPVEPGFLGPCIAYDGVVPCPAGPYGERHVIATGADPACENCSPCFDEAVSACNAASAVVYPEPNCQGGGAAVIDTTCSTELGRSVEIDVSPDCPETAPLPATIHGERTFCCVP